MDAPLLQPHFQDHDKAREYLEAKRWPDGPVCPHCGIIGEAVRLTAEESAKSHARRGLWNCRACRKQFSATVGTVFEDSHIPLNKWLMAFHLLCASKKGMSAHQLHRMLGVTYKSAWFMAHRIRYAMSQEPLSSKLTGIIEVDETYVGGKLRTGPMATKPEERPRDRQASVANKAPVVSVLQRGGRVQSMHIERVTSRNLKPIITQMVDESAHVMTDTSSALKGASLGRKLSQVNHRAKEYSRIEDGVTITTNTVEGYFSILKRYHHVGRQHLHRYLSEFDFRYNSREVTDGERARLALKQVDGKRLMLRDSSGKA